MDQQNEGSMKAADGFWWAMIAGFLVVVFGMELMTIIFAIRVPASQYEKRIIAMLLAIIIPSPLLVLAIAGYKLKKLLFSGGNPQYIWNTASAYALSILCVTYVAIVVLGGNLFSCW